MSAVRVADVVDAIERRFPVSRAEQWDRVGLLCGDRDAWVTGVVVALDPTRESIAATARAGANVLVTHHPAFLDPPAQLRPGAGAGGVLFEACRSGIALVNAHTNLDRDTEAQRLLPEALGLVALHPLESSVAPMSHVTVYIPAEFADAVVGAMASAGAGRLGEYERASFESTGVGSFSSLPDAKPFAGEPGEPTAVGESRVEVVCPRDRLVAVVAAAAHIHPYEEPLIVATDVSITRNGSALGMVCEPTQSLSLSDLVARAEAAFRVRPRVWGDAGRSAGVVATATGSAGSLLSRARAAGVQTLVCGEVRYHDALDAASAGLSIVELGHDVSEWPLVALLERAVRSTHGLEPDAVHALTAEPGWWST